MIQNNPHVDWIAVACGGDGTAAWVFSVEDKLAMKKCPPVQSTTSLNLRGTS